MLSGQEIKFFKSLTSKKVRDDLGLFIVEGEKMVDEALHSDFELSRVLYMDDIGEKAMSRITLLSSPSPAYAVLKKKRPEKTIIIDPSKFYIALDSVRDPGNLGTILRLADWFGVESIIASYDTVDSYNPKVIQASMGAIFRVTIFYTDLNELISANKDTSLIYGTFMDGPSIYETHFSGKGIVIMGSESNGISPNLESLIEKKIHIPSFEKKGSRGSESLNVAIATAIVCSEFRRSSV